MLKFDSHPQSLKQFFDEMEILGRECSLSQLELIMHTIRYLDGNNYKIWNSCPAAHDGDWLRFQCSITVLYPGAEDKNWYTVTNLKIFIENQAVVPMQDQIQFGNYYRKFIIMSNWLLDQGHISCQEQNKMFMARFHIDFRNQL